VLACHDDLKAELAQCFATMHGPTTKVLLVEEAGGAFFELQVSPAHNDAQWAECDGQGTVKTCMKLKTKQQMTGRCFTCPRRADLFVKAGASEEKHGECGNVFVIYFLVAMVYTLCTTSACIVFLKNLIADASSAWSAA